MSNTVGVNGCSGDYATCWNSAEVIKSVLTYVDIEEKGCRACVVQCRHEMDKKGQPNKIKNFTVANITTGIHNLMVDLKDGAEADHACMKELIDTMLLFLNMLTKVEERNTDGRDLRENDGDSVGD